MPAADIQRYYNANIQQYQTQEQIRASHILLKTEGKDEAAVRKQAEDVLAQVKAGGDFAELARKFSEDTSKEQGGDLDFFTRGRMVPEFEAAAFALAPGQTSEIVKSLFGFHIIRVDRQASRLDAHAGRSAPADSGHAAAGDRRPADQRQGAAAAGPDQGRRRPRRGGRRKRADGAGIRPVPADRPGPRTGPGAPGRQRGVHAGRRGRQRRAGDAAWRRLRDGGGQEGRLRPEPGRGEGAGARRHDARHARPS